MNPYRAMSVNWMFPSNLSLLFSLQMTKLGHLFCRIFHSLNFVECIPMVSFNTFFCPYISCKLVVRYKGLINECLIFFLQEYFIGNTV